jgi:hypothetical protein
VPADRRLVTIDEHTAMLGDGIGWTVEGSGHVGVILGDGERSFAAGEGFEEALLTPASDGVAAVTEGAP